MGEIKEIKQMFPYLKIYSNFFKREQGYINVVVQNEQKKWEKLLENALNPQSCSSDDEDEYDTTYYSKTYYEKTLEYARTGNISEILKLENPHHILEHLAIAAGFGYFEAINNEKHPEILIKRLDKDEQSSASNIFKEAITLDAIQIATELRNYSSLVKLLNLYPKSCEDKVGYILHYGAKEDEKIFNIGLKYIKSLSKFDSSVANALTSAATRNNLNIVNTLLKTKETRDRLTSNGFCMVFRNCILSQYTLKDTFNVILT